MLGTAAEAATQGILDNNNSPSRKVGEPDNRDSHYWFARYWADALASQTGDAELAAHFAPIAKALTAGEPLFWLSWPQCKARLLISVGIIVQALRKKSFGYAPKRNIECDHRLINL